MRVPAERSLEDPPVAGPIEDGAPVLELADPAGDSSACSWAIRGLFRYLPPTIVSRKWTCHVIVRRDVPQRRRDATLGHDRMRLAEQRLAHEPDVRARPQLAAIAARRPAPPAPITRTSCGRVCGSFGDIIAGRARRIRSRSPGR